MSKACPSGVRFILEAWACSEGAECYPGLGKCLRREGELIPVGAGGECAESCWGVASPDCFPG